MKFWQSPGMRGWRGLVLGLVAGLITAALVTFAADKASARMECPPDLQGCVTPKEHVRRFDAGKYGRARRDLPYPRIARLRYVGAVRRWNRNHGGENHKPLVAWRHLKRADTCTSNGYPTNMWTECSMRHFPREPRQWREGRITVAQCGAAMVPALFTGGSTFWIGWGSGVCLWQEME